VSPSFMNQRSFPAGQTSTALLKALLRALSAEKGAAVADAWLRNIRMVRDDMDDETRQVPLTSLHRALVVFADFSSRESIPRITPQLVAPDNLGFWVRLLRGTSEPAEAFARLDSADSQHGCTTRWETTLVGHGSWRGRVTIAHDPSIEHDGLLRLARLAELAAVPALFGFRGARAASIPDAVDRASVLTQDFEVFWSVPDARWSAAIGAAAGLAVGSLPLAIRLATFDLDMAVAGVGAATGLLGGFIRAREQLRRADSEAQQIRVLALERSLWLKESHEREAGGQLEGTVVAGQYRVVRRMGSGATGVIYEAVRNSDGLPVAIKLLRAAAAHEAVASDRLRREAEALGLAWHPNVVEVIDHGRLADGTAYLVMELLSGESLAARIHAKGRLTAAELWPIAMQVCEALAAVHAAGVVHRDLKPSNIYLSTHRDDPSGAERAKLIDFGIARVEWEETRITNTGGPLGTPGYMSPEQEAGDANVDARSDLFALGAVLYECLVGEPPPPLTPSGTVMRATSFSRRDSGTQEAATRVPPAWRAIIDRALAVRPEDRFHDARSFAQALRAVGGSVAKAEGST
jgi:protein kinase-like protein